MHLEVIDDMEMLSRVMSGGGGRDESENGDSWESHQMMVVIRDGWECHLLLFSTWDSLAEVR
jgi:hypothetical protein